MDLLSIASGSSGNCYYVGSEETHLLVDAGVSGKKIESALNEIDRKPSDLNGILVTHEHIDHVKGLGVMARKHGIPIYTTGGTISEIKKMSSVGTIDDSLFHEIEPDEPFFINDLSIDASAIWHDAADPVCYSISDGKSKFSIATDMGNYDEYVVNKLKNSDIIYTDASGGTLSVLSEATYSGKPRTSVQRAFRAVDKGVVKQPYQSNPAWTPE